MVAVSTSGAPTPAGPRVDIHEISGHTTIVALAGEHDLSTKHRVVQGLESARLAATVIVDLASCSFLESTVIESLLHARDRMHLEIVMPPHGSAADRALHLTGVTDFVATHVSLEDALKSSEPPRAEV